MTELATAWLGWIVPASLQVALLGLFVCVLDLLIVRKAWPEVRTALWAAVLLRIVVPPHVAAFEVIRDGGMQRAALATGSHLEVAGLFAAWLIGVLAGAFACRRRSRAIDLFLRDATVGVVDGEVLAMVRDVARMVGLRRVPELRAGGASLIPAAVGLRRHRVVVPCTLLDRAAGEELRHVLLHEFSHIRRKDSAVALVALSLRTLFWFHPIAWIAAARLAGLREVGCDQEVAARLGSGAREYARTLANLARPALGRAQLGSTALFGRTSELVHRLERLASPSVAHVGYRRGLAAGLLFMLLACGPGIEPSAPPPVAPSESSPGRRGCMQLRFEVMRMLAEEQASGR